MVSIDEAINNVKKYPVQSEIDEKITEDYVENSIVESVKKILKVFKDKKAYIALSGGLDSSLLVALISKNFPGYRIIGVTVGSKKSSDIKFSRLVAKKFDIEHIIEKITYDDIENSILDCIDVTKKIKNNIGCDISLFLLYKFISKHTKKVMVGDGVDELAFGDSSYRNPKEYFRNIIAKNDEERKIIDKSIDYKDFPKAKNFFFLMKYVWKYELFMSLQYFREYSNYFKLKVMLPYLSENLMEILNKIPIENKIDKDETKKIIREIASKYLPKDIISRNKVGTPNIVNSVFLNNDNP